MLIAQANVQSNYQLQVTTAPEFFNREIQYMSAQGARLHAPNE